MAQVPITLTERMKMMLIEPFIDDDDGDGDNDGAGNDDGDSAYDGDGDDNGDDNDDGDDEIERVWSCMLCVLGRPLS